MRQHVRRTLSAVRAAGGVTEAAMAKTYGKRWHSWRVGTFRVQIIDGVLYAVPPESCPGSWQYGDCGAWNVL